MASQGRISLKSPDTATLFRMYDRIPVNQSITGRELIDTVWESTPLTTAFFSPANRQILQNGIRATVYHMSNEQYVIEPVDPHALTQMMTSVYMQDARHNPATFREDLARMNDAVIALAARHCYGEAQSYLKYRNDIATLAVPLAHPVLMNTKDKQLEWNGWSRYTGVTHPSPL